MLSSTVDIHNTRKEEIDKSAEDKNYKIDEPKVKSYLPCSTSQLLLIIVPASVIVLFAVIFIPVYVLENQNDDEIVKVQEEFDEFEEHIVNITYATLTPKDGYDNILIFLGGISEFANTYFDFFKSKSTFVPKGTKIYFLAGKPREMQYMIDKGFDKENYPVWPGWFNVDSTGKLKPEGVFDDAIESKNLVLDEIDRIKTVENIRYRNIYLSGFSQGAIMTNYILLNSRYELGGYIAFSGYILDDLFPADNVLNIEDLSSEQKSKLDAKKDYHILATHSFNDDSVPYYRAIPSYYTYYKDYTDFKLLSFGYLGHKFPEQPIHPIVKRWLKESMGK